MKRASNDAAFSSETYFLGVDGGGTKTAFLLLDNAGRVLAQHQSGTAYYLETGLNASAEMLRNGVAGTLKLAGLAAEDIRYAFFGLPAYGEDSALQPKLDALPASLLAPQRYRCGNDMVCGWAGSLLGADGINVVAGTGSIAYGEWAGRSARAGGWGELFSDEGSAHWIAIEGLRLFARMSDGRAAPGPLLALVRERFELHLDLDLCAAIYTDLAHQRGAQAQLAKLVAVAAQAGDVQAREIFERAAVQLCELVSATRASLGVPPEQVLPLSYSGGVFASGELLLAPFSTACAALPEPYVLSRPKLAPVFGAALYAARCSGSPLSPTAIERLVSVAANEKEVTNE